MKRMIDDELLTADKKGITVGKNLEIGGTTKLNGGLEAIHYYNIQSTPGGYKLIVLFEKYDEINNSYCAFGFLEHEGDSIYPGVFDYSINNGAITRFHGVFENTIYDFNEGNLTESQIATLSN